MHSKNAQIKTLKRRITFLGRYYAMVKFMLVIVSDYFKVRFHCN